MDETTPESQCAAANAITDVLEGDDHEYISEFADYSAQLDENDQGEINGLAREFQGAFVRESSNMLET